MSFFNIPLNCSPKCDAWEDILAHYHDWVDDEDIWEIAKESPRIPILGNIYQKLILDRLLDHFYKETGKTENDLDIYFWVNSIDTHLIIDKWDICTVDDYWGAVKKHKNH